jgi:hypothetical protein
MECHPVHLRDEAEEEIKFACGEEFFIQKW